MSASERKIEEEDAREWRLQGIVSDQYADGELLTMVSPDGLLADREIITVVPKSVLVAERTRSGEAEEKLAEAMREYDAAAHNCEAWSADCSRLEARSRELEDAYNAEHDRAARAERTLEILEGKLKGDPHGVGAKEQARADALCGGDSEQ